MAARALASAVFECSLGSMMLEATELGLCSVVFLSEDGGAGQVEGAARSVGAALGANPVPLVVPCHRVLRADDALGGYSAGLEIKRALLAHEGHEFVAG